MPQGVACQLTSADTLVPATIKSASLEANATVATFQQGTNGYSGAQDTFVEAVHPDTNYGSSTLLAVSTRGYEENRSLVKFELQAMPANARVSRHRSTFIPSIRDPQRFAWPPMI